MPKPRARFAGGALVVAESGELAALEVIAALAEPDALAALDVFPELVAAVDVESDGFGCCFLFVLFFFWQVPSRPACALVASKGTHPALTCQCAPAAA